MHLLQQCSPVIVQYDHRFAKRHQCQGLLLLQRSCLLLAGQALWPLRQPRKSSGSTSEPFLLASKNGPDLKIQDCPEVRDAALGVLCAL